MKSDNGPSIDSDEFDNWARFIGFRHRKKIPLWPQVNGEAERYVRTLGKIIRTAMIETGSWKQKLFTFLRHYRTTPQTTTGMSPSEMLNKRKLRTEVPAVSRRKKVSFEDQLDFAIKRDARTKHYRKDLSYSRTMIRHCRLETKYS